ncbi:hypothetical protein [Streptomyces sp. Agncl-13]|uniref:hypothetical protein n=1 Tax=Streptomyces sp. Agncl-13 TaxID=3400628 RepID=UPI003A8B5DEA
MSTFDTLREQLRQARQSRDDADAAIDATGERMKRLALRDAQSQRVFDADDAQHVATRDALARERAHLDAELERLRGEREAAIAAERALVDEFAVFSDPLTGIRRLDDSIPILLMPVRLETRFRRSAPEPGVEPRDELLVRVYPDDCWIDTFDPALTASEFTDARRYWTAIWQAGGIEDHERGAWRALASAHGSGRSAWIVRQYRPGNLPAKPAKASPQDVILTVVVDTALPGTEPDAVAAYWSAVWRADGEAAASATARTALDAAVGTARAEHLVATTVPANLDAPPAAGFSKPDVSVSVAYLELPAADTKQTAWARPPRADILPDRFVFVGYEAVGDTTPVVVVGRPVPSPLILGPDPGATEADQLRLDEEGDLVIPDELRWMADFEEAVSVGMGIVVGLTPAQAERGFDRVLVVGLRINADEASAKTELEELLRHHSYRRTGLAVVPQGTPTNNTEAVSSGRSLDDPDAAFDDLKQPLFQPATDWLDKSDGQWLAEQLGIDPAVFAHTHAADGRDQATARAMNAALWPATLGYWMETMLAPVFSEGAIDATRAFFTRHVIAGGACPSIRIGEQPYGILPTTAISRMAWFDRPGGIGVTAAGRGGPTADYLKRLYPVLLSIDQDIRTKVADVAHVGGSGDPHAILLDILGLHSGSVEWAQRHAESLKTLFNRLNLLGLGDFARTFRTRLERAAARQKLGSLGYAGEKDPQILDLSFSGRHNVLKGGVVDDRPLSETAPIRPYTDAGVNYLRWLIDAARTSHDALYQERGFTGDEQPTAILYLLLRHALQLGYSDTGIRLFESAGLYSPEKALAARSDDPFLHIRDNRLDSESRYFPLYTAAPAITGHADQPVHEYIAANIPTVLSSSLLHEQLKALERLENRPTAQLERAFADHVDCCGYRLDAWLLGIVNVQLATMRNLRDDSKEPAREGIHLGGYAWLEPVRPEGKMLEPVELTDDDLRKAFAGAPALVHDSTNHGYVHAPSLNHAVTAAVLRNGYLSHTSPANRRTMAVNLTSERVRTALAMIEGIRAGQSLSNLLGYQFERGLHDRHGLAEVDKVVYKLRKAFPMRADRIRSTRTRDDVSIESIEARNVVDGLALVEHMTATDTFNYPFGKGDMLPAVSPAEQAAIDAEADRLREAHDAIADLALSEGVHQAVLGNYDRVASTYDAYARGSFPPEPDIVRTPRNGIGLTHRVALHLEPGVSATNSPVPGVPMTPRAQAEPALNSWLAGILPSPADVGCAVTFRSAATGTAVTKEVTLDQLGLQPADLLVVIRDDREQAMAELDDRIVRVVEAAFDPRPDVPVSIEYMKRPSAPFSVFELLPLVRNLRRLTTRSRALRPSDLTLMNEAGEATDRGPVADKSRLDLVRGSMHTLRDDFASFLPGLEGPLADLANRKAEILTNVDTYAADLVALLSRAARFSVPQTGWGFVYDFRRRTFAALLEQCAALVKRWDARLAEFDAGVAASHTAATDEEKLALLAQAERAISTTATSPPPTPTAYESDLVNVKRPAFDARRQQFTAIAATQRRSVAGLLADVQALQISNFDIAAFDITAHEDEMVRFAEDAVRMVTVVQAELDRRLKSSKDRFDEHDASARAATRLTALADAARALLGEDFKICPEFGLATAQGDELAKAVAASTSGELFEYLTNPTDPERPPVDFPVDDWLYGIARVREKLHAWEQVVMFAGALQRPEPELLAVQLPFTADDRWIGLDFPASLTLDGDRLLYTAHHAVAFDKSARQCGLLLDEWTETIPVESVDTGIVFHHDRPNSEAPQAMLLVTPTTFRGRWRWDDLIDALNETLDLAKKRAVEPADLDGSPYAPFLPATVLATQVQQLTIAADLALNNNIAVRET